MISSTFISFRQNTLFILFFYAIGNVINNFIASVFSFFDSVTIFYDRTDQDFSAKKCLFHVPRQSLHSVSPTFHTIGNKWTLNIKTLGILAVKWRAIVISVKFDCLWSQYFDDCLRVTLHLKRSGPIVTWRRLRRD